MEVLPYADTHLEDWNAFNRRARNGHFLFDRGYMDYHADRFVDASLLALERSKLAAILPANRHDDTIYSHRGLTFGGLVVDDLRTVDILDTLDSCAAAWRAAGAQRLVYKPLPWIYHRRPTQEDLYWLYRRGARLVSRQATAAIAHLEPGPRSARRLRGARKAVQSGLQFRRSDDIAAYWPLLEEVLGTRHGARPVHTAAEMQLLATRFPNNINLWVAERDGDVLAGAILYVSPRVVHAQYIAASAAGRKEGALDGLFLHLLEQPTTAAFFDFGTSNAANGLVLNEGLIRQKEEFGASVAVHDIYELDL